MMPKLDWIVLALVWGVAECSPRAAASFPQDLAQRPDSTIAAPNSGPATQRRPRSRLGGRNGGGVCVVSPGLLEPENVIWSDRPLFLWRTESDAVTMQQLNVSDQEGKLLWEQPLTATAQQAIYAGQPLQPGQFYRWQLKWTVQGEAQSVDYTFQVMESDRRDQIAAGLQTVSRQLQATGASAEAIANQQADYLVNQAEPLWSDALQVLSSVDRPSTVTRQTIATWMSAVCSQEN